MAKNSGQLSDRMAQASNKYYSEKLGKPVDFFRAGDKTDVAHAVGPDGKSLNITNAERTEGGMTARWADGKITETGAFKNRDEVLAEADRLEKDGHPVAGLGLRRLAGSINPDEAISLENKVKLQEPYSNLQTIPGIGKIIALTIMLETGHVERFADTGSYVSYCRKVHSNLSPNVLVGEWTSNGKQKGRGKGQRITL